MKKITILSLAFTLFTGAFLASLVFAPTTLGLTTCDYTKLGNPAGQPVYPPGCSGGGAADVVKLAKAQIPKIYGWGSPPRNWAAEDPAAGKTPDHFDCSGLTGWAQYWGTGGKVNMHGQTQADWDERNNTAKYKLLSTDMNALQPGDAVYFGNASTNTVHHVAVYEGAGGCGTAHCMIEAPDIGKPIVESKLEGRDFIGALRPVIN